MHPLTIYEIAVREHEHATLERARLRARHADQRSRSRTVRRVRLPSRRPVAANDGRPAVI